MQLANIFTKPLMKARFDELKKLMRMNSHELGGMFELEVIHSKYADDLEVQRI
jgi:hypothetical protein